MRPFYTQYTRSKRLFFQLLIASILTTSSFISFGQGLEGIIVEEYYISNAADAEPVFGIPGPVVGSTTYRIYVDLAPEYKLQQVPGFPTNMLEFSTTTGFYNAPGASVSFADNFNGFTFGLGAVPLDSYLSLGIAGPNYAGVVKTDDTNGSIFENSGRLQNSTIPITTVDGFEPSTDAQLPVQVLGIIPLDFVNVNGASSSVADNGIFYNLDGTQGILPENKILIAQLTTDGELSFKINLQIFSSVTLLTERYTHTNVIDFDPILNPGEEVSVVFPGLVYPLVITGCTSSTSCNFLVDATVDDGSCIEPIANCQACNAENTGLVIVDSDSDGICDAEDPCPFLADLTNGDVCTTGDDEQGVVADCNCVLVVVPGCTIPTACNFNPDANQNDGSCIVPIENCQLCNADNTGLVIVDTDGDGICDAEEISGCTSETACNYDVEATDEDGNCIEPIENCQACNADNTGLVIVDSDGDGICDAEEIEGCTDPKAVNFDPVATDDDGSCLYPAEISIGDLDCESGNAMILQITGASTEPTDGGIPVAETRTIYAYDPDNASGVPTYVGALWPYVVVPNGFLVTDGDISATIDVNSENVLTVNGWPAYQYTGDTEGDQANGLFGPWNYFESDGALSQDACLVGVTDVSFENGFIIYPNPTSGILNIKTLMNAQLGKDVEIIVYNALGVQVYKSNLRFSSTIHVLTLNLTDLKDGVYFIQIADLSSRTAMRFIKVK